jgi:hypothetical protein
LENEEYWEMVERGKVGWVFGVLKKIEVSKVVWGI